MKKIKQRINDIRLQNKLVIIYVVTGLIPLIVLFVFAYCQMRNILMDRDLKSIKGALEQSVATVDGQIEVYDNLSNYITFNIRCRECFRTITKAHMRCITRLSLHLTLCFHH